MDINTTVKVKHYAQITENSVMLLTRCNKLIFLHGFGCINALPISLEVLVSCASIQGVLSISKIEFARLVTITDENTIIITDNYTILSSARQISSKILKESNSDLRKTLDNVQIQRTMSTICAYCLYCDESCNMQFELLLQVIPDVAKRHVEAYRRIVPT